MKKIKWKRNCPGCNIELFYSRKSNLTYANKYNCMCSTCRNRLTNSKRKGKTYEEIYGITKAKKIKDKFSKQRTGRKLTNVWKSKIKETSVFANLTGKERYDKLLKSRVGNLTYDEYLSNMKEYQRYKNNVRNITEKQSLYMLENYDKRGLAGISGSFHLDHIIPISYGYENNISPEKIGNINNLRFIPWKDNLKKSNKLIQ